MEMEEVSNSNHITRNSFLQFNKKTTEVNTRQSIAIRSSYANADRVYGRNITCPKMVRAFLNDVGAL
jgi:hypothetical protein